jgi:hypothetical protein
VALVGSSAARPASPGRGELTWAVATRRHGRSSSPHGRHPDVLLARRVHPADDVRVRDPLPAPVRRLDQGPAGELRPYGDSPDYDRLQYLVLAGVYFCRNDGCFSWHNFGRALDLDACTGRARSGATRTTRTTWTPAGGSAALPARTGHRAAGTSATCSTATTTAPTATTCTWTTRRCRWCATRRRGAGRVRAAVLREFLGSSLTSPGSGTGHRGAFRQSRARSASAATRGSPRPLAGLVRQGGCPRLRRHGVRDDGVAARLTGGRLTPRSPQMSLTARRASGLSTPQVISCSVSALGGLVVDHGEGAQVLLADGEHPPVVVARAGTGSSMRSGPAGRPSPTARPCSASRSRRGAAAAPRRRWGCPRAAAPRRARRRSRRAAPACGP